MTGCFNKIIAGERGGEKNKYHRSPTGGSRGVNNYTGVWTQYLVIILFINPSVECLDNFFCLFGTGNIEF